jgi:two-component system CheB/CheR fusion protein
VDIPVVMVSNDLRIRRFTPPAQKLLNLLPGDIGRRLGEIRPNLDVEDLETLAREAIRHAAPQEREVRTNEGGWQVLHVRPYKTWDNRIEGAVISLQDVDALKRTLDGKLIYELGNGQWNIPRLRELLEEIIPRNSRVDDFEMSHDFPHLGPREMLLNARRVELQPGHPFILLAIEDVTQKRREGAA